MFVAVWRAIASTDSRVLKCLLEGNIVAENHDNKEARSALRSLRFRATSTKQPCIYGDSSPLSRVYRPL